MHKCWRVVTDRVSDTLSACHGFVVLPFHGLQREGSFARSSCFDKNRQMTINRFPSSEAILSGKSCQDFQRHRRFWKLELQNRRGLA
jgi:hypothetical protein